MGTASAHRLAGEQRRAGASRGLAGDWTLSSGGRWRSTPRTDGPQIAHEAAGAMISDVVHLWDHRLPGCRAGLPRAAWASRLGSSRLPSHCAGDKCVHLGKNLTRLNRAAGNHVGGERHGGHAVHEKLGARTNEGQRARGPGSLQCRQKGSGRWVQVHGRKEETTMTTITIQNAEPGEHADIQTLLARHGFGLLAEQHGTLVALHPDSLPATDRNTIERDLLRLVGKHLAVSWS
jgi:hypothetical protein